MTDLIDDFIICSLSTRWICRDNAYQVSGGKLALLVKIKAIRNFLKARIAYKQRKSVIFVDLYQNYLDLLVKHLTK